MSTNHAPTDNQTKRGDCTFACGCQIRGVQDPTPVCSHVDKAGRFRLVVYDSHTTKITVPTDATGHPAPCRYECPCKGKANRRLNRGFPPDYQEGQAAPVSWQYWVTCYGTWRENNATREDVQ